MTRSRIKLNSRLAALARPAETPTLGVAVGAPASVWGSSPATISAKGTGGSAPVALNRGGTGGPPIELSRGGVGSMPAPAMVTTKLVDKSAVEEPADGGQRHRAPDAGGRSAARPDRRSSDPELRQARVPRLGEA